MKNTPAWFHSKNRRGAGSGLLCNGPLLKYLREARQLTQAELARVTGFSERLIVKAEAGGTLSKNTLQVIAQALSEVGLSDVCLEDLTSDPVAIAKYYTESLYMRGAGFFEAIEDFIDQQAVFLIHGDPQVIPFAGRWEGLEQIAEGFKLFFSIMEPPPSHDVLKHYQFIAQGSDVVAWGDSYLRPVGAPALAPMRVSNLFRFKRGKIYCFEDNFDTDRASKLFAGD